MNSILISLVTYYASLYGIDPNVALAVAKVESGYRVGAIGQAGELGLFQLMPSTYPEFTKEELLKPETNIALGIKYLAWNKKYCKHQHDFQYVNCFNYGIKNANRIKHPTLFPYYRKIQKELRAMEEFKKGDKVMVKDIHNMTHDGEGTFIGPATEVPWKQLGYVKVEVTHMVMNIEKDRLINYDKYWTKK